MEEILIYMRKGTRRVQKNRVQRSNVEEVERLIGDLKAVRPDDIPAELLKRWQKLSTGLHRKPVNGQTIGLSQPSYHPHLCSLRIMMEKPRARRQPLYLCFVNFEKAFDKVSHKKLWK
jgi:hypothetical protein